jgi:RNA polymerase sigma factor (sigma-70 family)
MATSTPDAECLRRFVAAGDERAFAEVVERHVHLVHGAAMRILANADAAQEVAQSVFILLAKQAWRLTGHPALAGWLYRTAVLQACDYRRSQARRRQRELHAVAVGSTMNHAESSSTLSELEPELDEAMLELGARDREILVLRFFSGKTTLREVGASLGIREDAAQKRVSRALDALTRCFQRRGLRVAAPALTAVALQNAAVSAGAAPAGLAAAITQGAVTAVPALSFNTAAVTAAKIMSLTKTQVTLVCTTLALAPIGYEWHASAAAKSDTQRLGAELRDLRRAAMTGEKRRLETERQIGNLEREIAKSSAEPGTPDASAKLAPARWDDRSPYVRLPRNVFAKVNFTEFDTATAADGKTDRIPLQVLNSDGQPRPALEAALGLSPAETQQFRQVCRDAFAEFHARIAQHTITTHPNTQDQEVVRIDVSAFAEEGAAFQQRFRERLTTMLGPERTEAFWLQAAPVFRDVFNDFGTNAIIFQLMKSNDGLVEYLYQTSQLRSIGKVEYLHGMLIPKALQPIADAWTKSTTPPPTGGAR